MKIDTKKIKRLTKENRNVIGGAVAALIVILIGIGVISEEEVQMNCQQAKLFAEDAEKFATVARETVIEVCTNYQ